MDRVTVYRDELPYETDILGIERFVFQALGLLCRDLFGTATQFAGFPCTPTGPASMNVVVGPGRVYKQEALETTPWGQRDGTGGLPAVTDAENFIVKQGLRMVNTTFATPAPATVTHSIKYLIEADFTEVDDADTTLQFYNVDNPSIPIADDASPARRDKANLYLKAGTSAVSPTIPPTTAGRIPLWVITVAQTDTTVTAGNIAAAPSAPLISVGGGGGGGSGLTPWSVLATTHLAVAGERIIADTSGGAFTITLPASPAAGAEFTVKGDFLTNNLTIGRNGHTISGSATDLVLNKNNITAFLVYDGSTWRV